MPEQSLRTTEHVPETSATVEHVPAPDSTVDSQLSTLESAQGDLPVVPGYRVLREIARGGMGRVLAAHDLTLDREVALKILLPGAAADRFVRESKITARLPHPGIPPVHALGTLNDGSPFLAMKLIAGQTLAQKLLKAAERPLLLPAFEQVCQAVGFAHSRGVIHRDLKPANVMVGAFGEVQVMDWGLAKEMGNGEWGMGNEKQDSASSSIPQSKEMGNGEWGMGNEKQDSASSSIPNSPFPIPNSPFPIPNSPFRIPHSEETQSGAILGTPAYMAPEQARAESADARADVFALGGILCAVLTGNPPFVGKSMIEVIRRAAAGDVAEANARLDGCGADAELVALCKRCLSPAAADRPADGQMVAAAVAGYRAGVEQRLRAAERERAAAEAKAAEQKKRRRVQLALVAAVALLFLGGGAFAWWRDRQARSTQQRLERNADALTALSTACENALRNGDAVKASAVLAEADRRLADGGGDDLRDRLTGLHADLAMLQELHAIDLFRWTPVGSRFPRDEMIAKRIRNAFERFGASAGTMPAEELARRVSASAIRDRLVVALDRWLDGEKSAEVRAVLRLLDPDPYRDQVRDAVEAKNPSEIAKLAGRPEALAQPVEFTLFLGEHRAVPMARGRVLLTAARHRRPGELAVLMALGWTYPLNVRNSANERVRWFQAAVEVAPDNPCPHHNLGMALRDRGDADGAVVEFREAIRLDANFPQPHNSLGNALFETGDWNGAAVAYRDAIRLSPDDPYPHNGLGNALRLLGDLTGAIVAFKEAIRLDVNYAMPHNGLGDALYFQGDLNGAIVEYKEAIRRDPKEIRAINGLGIVLENKGDLDGAIKAYEQAIRADPNSPYGPWNLRRAKRWRELFPRLADIMAGRAQPKTPAEARDFGRLCGQPFVKRTVAAVRLYEAAFAGDPKLADDADSGHRYSAVCYAALAVAGQGADAANLTPAERSTLRAKALGWLRAELSFRQKQAASAEPAERRTAAFTLSHWLRDSDLAGTRAGLERKGWLSAESAAWDTFWEEVRATVAKANGTPAGTALPRQ